MIPKRAYGQFLKAFVIGAPFLLFLPALLTGKALFWGTPSMQFIPWNYLAFQQMSEGILPSWNLYNGMGAPLLANYQLAFFYPPNWIGYLLAALGGVSWMAWGQTLLMGLHLSLAAAGMVALQRKNGIGQAGQLVSGLAFGMCAYLVARVGFFSIVIASCWLPWVFVAAENLLRVTLDPQKKVRDIIRASLFLCSCASMQLLSGHAQVTFYTLLLVMAWAVLRGARGNGWHGILRALAVMTAVYLLAGLIAAIQLLPTLEYLFESQRSTAVEYSTAMVYSFWPWKFLTLLFPDFFGNPGFGNYWGYANFWEDAVYIGLLPLIAAAGTFITLIRSRKKKDTAAHSTILIFCWVTVSIGFLLALGWNTPVFPFLYEHVPTFDMFNGPARFLIWVEFGLSVLAGIGIDGWKRPKDGGLKRTRLAVAGSLAVAAGALLSTFVLKGVNLTFVPAAALAGVLGAGTALMALWIPENREAGAELRWTAVLVMLVAVDLFLANWKLNPFIEANFYQAGMDSRPAGTIGNDQRIYLPADDEYRMKFDRFFTFKSFRKLEDWGPLWSSNLPDTNILTGRQMFNNFDPMVPARFARLRDYLAKAGDGERVRLLKALSVTTIQSIPGGDPGVSELKPIDGLSRFRLYPCAAFVQDSESAWRVLQLRIDSNETELFTPPIIEGNVSGQNCSDILEKKIRIINRSMDRVSLEVITSKEAWLEMAETYYPGWKASVDGRAAAIYPSNTIFKSVRIPAGSHTVEFKYQPASISCGAVLSISGLVVFGIALYLSGKSGHRNKPNL